MVMGKFAMGYLAEQVFLIIWLVDPRGVYGIYPWWVLCWMRDIFNFVKLACFLVFFSNLLALWQNLQGELIRKVMFRSAYIPSVILGLFWLIIDIPRIAFNRTWPIGILLSAIGLIDGLFRIQVL
jgi:hypothetical protein